MNKYLFILLYLGISLIACKKLGTEPTISNEDAANIVAGALAANSSGLVTISGDASLSSQALIINNTGCGVTSTDSVSHQSMQGSETSYGYKVKLVSKLNCNTNNLADNVTSNITYSGYFNGPRVFVTNSGSASFVIAGLTPTASVYAINGNYKSTGAFKLKADTTKSGSASIELNIKNLLISKAAAIATIPVASGTATIAITGSSPKKGVFAFNGSLTFNSSTSATLNLDGTVYIINLSSGVAVRQ